MASANFDGSPFFSCYDMEKSLIFGYFYILVDEAFENDVWLLGFIDGHHFDLVAANFNDSREWIFTYFTLELSKIIRISNFIDILLHLTIDPLLQASYMNLLA